MFQHLLQDVDALPWRQGEVDQCDLSGDLWSVVRVGKLGSDVELEVFMVWDDGVTQLDDSAALLLKGLRKTKISSDRCLQRDAKSLPGNPGSTTIRYVDSHQTKKGSDCSSLRIWKTIHA